MQFGLFENPQATTVSESNRAGRSARNDAQPVDSVASAGRAAVLEIVREAGSNGATSSDIAQRLSKPKNAFSGRITELVQAGLLFRRAGVRRGKDSVLFAKGFE